MVYLFYKYADKQDGQDTEDIQDELIIMNILFILKILFILFVKKNTLAQLGREQDSRGSTQIDQRPLVISRLPITGQTVHLRGPPGPFRFPLSGGFRRMVAGKDSQPLILSLWQDRFRILVLVIVFLCDLPKQILQKDDD